MPKLRLHPVYRDLGTLQKTSGIILNGDHMTYPSGQKVLCALASQVKERRQAAKRESATLEYQHWWDVLTKEIEDSGSAPEELTEYRRIHLETVEIRKAPTPGYVIHEAALLDAGYSQVGTIWQQWDNRIVLAVHQ